MAHTASRTSMGFEPIYNKSLGAVPNPVDYELTPAEAFVRGDMVALSAGKLTKAAAGTVADIIGVMAESITAAENPTGTTVYGQVYDHPDNVYRCTFADHRDAAATGGTTSTLLDSALSTSSNDVWNGALMYVYEGPAAGSIRTVKDYVGVSDTLEVSTLFPAAPTTASKYIMLGLAAEANDVINVGLGGIVLKDENTIDANAGRLSSAVKVGPLVCVGASKIADLMLDVMIRRSCHFTG